MAVARAFCPYCRNESISMSSAVLARKRRLNHIKKQHPNEDFADPYLKANGEEHTV